MNNPYNKIFIIFVPPTGSIMKIFTLLIFASLTTVVNNLETGIDRPDQRVRLP
ncbi:MAG: hypothetical protein R2744_13785 [Bacteroidales bacterium]